MIVRLLVIVPVRLNVEPFLTLVGSAEGLIVSVDVTGLYIEKDFVYVFVVPDESLAVYLSV